MLPKPKMRVKISAYYLPLLSKSYQYKGQLVDLCYFVLAHLHTIEYRFAWANRAGQTIRRDIIGCFRFELVSLQPAPSLHAKGTALSIALKSS